MAPKLVRDLMTVGVPTCKWETPIVEIARFLLEQNVEAMCVLDAEGHGIGVVGEDELVWAYAREGYKSLTAEDIMERRHPRDSTGSSAGDRGTDDAGSEDSHCLSAT